MMKTQKLVAVAAAGTLAASGLAGLVLPDTSNAADAQVVKVADPKADAVRSDVGITSVDGAVLKFDSFDSSQQGLRVYRDADSIDLIAQAAAGVKENVWTAKGDTPIMRMKAEAAATDLYGRSLDVVYDVTKVEVINYTEDLEAYEEVMAYVTETNDVFHIGAGSGATVARPGNDGLLKVSVSIKFYEHGTNTEVNGLVAAVKTTDLDTVHPKKVVGIGDSGFAWGCPYAEGVTYNSGYVEPFYVAEDTYLDISGTMFCAGEDPEGRNAGARDRLPQDTVLAGVTSGVNMTIQVNLNAGSETKIEAYDLTATPVEEDGTISRTINYVDSDGKPVADPVTQTIKAKRTGTKLVNGETLWGDWEPTETAVDVTSPQVPGMTTNTLVVPGAPFEDATVVYEKKPTYWVTYVDPDGTVYLEKTDVPEGEAEPAAPDNPADLAQMKFMGWDRTVDEAGNVTYMAWWAPAIWDMYVDEDGTVYQDKILYEENNPDAVPGAPADPTKAGFKFAGWDVKVDEFGNRTFTAKWEAEAAPAPSASASPVTYSTATASTPTQAAIQSALAKTGINTPLELVLVMGGLGLTGGLLAAMRRLTRV